MIEAMLCPLVSSGVVTSRRPARSSRGKRAACLANGEQAADARGTALAAAVAALAGSVAAAPLTLALGALSQELPALLSPAWELDSDTLALSCAVLGAALSRTPSATHTVLLLLAVASRSAGHVHVSADCIAPPLACGPGGTYLDSAMTADLLATALTATVAFMTAAAAVRQLRAAVK